MYRSLPEIRIEPNHYGIVAEIKTNSLGYVSRLSCVGFLFAIHYIQICKGFYLPTIMFELGNCLCTLAGRQDGPALGASQAAQLPAGGTPLTSAPHPPPSGAGVGSASLGEQRIPPEEVLGWTSLTFQLRRNDQVRILLGVIGQVWIQQGHYREGNGRIWIHMGHCRGEEAARFYGRPIGRGFRGLVRSRHQE